MSFLSTMALLAPRDSLAADWGNLGPLAATREFGGGEGGGNLRDNF